MKQPNITHCDPHVVVLPKWHNFLCWPGSRISTRLGIRHLIDFYDYESCLEKYTEVLLISIINSSSLQEVLDVF